MTDNFWNEEVPSEYELLSEEIEAQEVPVYTPEEVDDEVLEEIAEESAFDLTQQQATSVYNAKLRLSQANLYEMLINHDLFEGVDADPQAIKNVSEELKQFIVARLEVLLGIRKQAPRDNPVQPEAIPDTFNETEVEFLKALSYKGTKGASGGLKPLAPKPEEKPKRKIRSAPNRKTSVPREEITKAVKKVKKQKAKKPLTIDEIAVQDLKELKNRKPFHKMSKKEKAAEIARVNAKHSKAPERPANAVPPMTAEQLTAKYTAEEARRNANKNDQVGNFNTMLATALAAQKSQGV